MAFETAGENNNDDKYDGIPFAWENLESKCCPRCGEALTLFEHIMMWKCGCGFKISSFKFHEIVDKIRDRGEFGLSRGYGFGGYQDEPPF